MRVSFKAIGLCFAVALSFTASVSADDNYIIGKEEDATLLSLSIAFAVVCGLFFLASIVMTVVMFRRAGVSGVGKEYQLEETEERYQSMYSIKKNDENMSPSHYEQLKLTETTNGVYQSISDNKSNGKQNNNMSKEGTPPGNEKGQGDAKESEKKNKTLSSFQNPAYQSTSMGSGLDVEYDVIPASEARNGDTAL